ncbi:MAG: DUF309 domain-containing protein [Jannaschia sp.]
MTPARTVRASPPPHAYVPGQTPRHPEGLFDPIRADLALAWETGLTYLSGGFYWEAHEVLEPVWMAQPPNAPERALTQGLIQLANAALKQRMGQPRATARLRKIADSHLAEALSRGGGCVSEFDSARLEALKRHLFDQKDAL